jgi:DNA gyrase/topoisomerase IV subunit B
MSTYINFFIRRGDNFIPLGDYSRNSIIYRIANSYAMWEKVSPLSKAGIEQMITEAERQQRAYQESITKIKAKMAQLKDLSCTWNEALEYLDGYEEAIQEYEQDIKEARYAKHFFGFLIDIIETVQYADKKEYDYNNYIYVGIEIGHPTVKDIV